MYSCQKLNMEKGYSYKKIWTVSYPVLIAMVMQNLVGLTDTAFLGRVGDGETALGASALAGVFYMVVFMVGFGFSVGAEIMMARRNGEGCYRSIGTIFYHGVGSLMLLGVVMIGVTKLFAPGILSRLIESPDVYAATMDYLDWRIYGMIFSSAAIMFRAFYMATTNTRILTINSLIMVGSNVVLDYVMIFGKFGFPEMGIAGAAMASVLAELLSLGFFIIYTYTKADKVKYGLSLLPRFSKYLEKRIFGLSGWTMLQYFVSTATWMIFFMAVENLGGRSLPISNMVRSVSALIFMFVAAFGYTGSALVSNLMGEGKPDQVIPLCRRTILMCVACMLPLYLVAAFFPTLLLRIYSDNAELVAEAVPSMLVMLGVYIVTVPSYILFLGVSGTGNTRYAFWMEVVSTAVYVAYVYYIVIYLRADIAVCWTSDAAYSIVLFVLCALYFKRSKWKERLI